MINFFQASLFSAVLLAFASQSVSAQTAATTEPAPDVIAENFDGSDVSLMLGGQLDLTPDQPTPWAKYVADGELVFENRKNPSSLTYNDIQWVKFPSSTVLRGTEGLLISVVVQADGSSSPSGGGVLIGSGKEGKYLMFAVDGEGRFHVLRKDGRQLRQVHSGLHPAVLTDAPNELTFRFEGEHIAFVANGTEIIQIPNPLLPRIVRSDTIRAGVGLSAFGLGTFKFDDVEIRKPN